MPAEVAVEEEGGNTSISKHSKRGGRGKNAKHVFCLLPTLFTHFRSWKATVRT